MALTFEQLMSEQPTPFILRTRVIHWRTMTCFWLSRILNPTEIDLSCYMSERIIIVDAKSMDCMLKELRDLECHHGDIWKMRNNYEVFHTWF